MYQLRNYQIEAVETARECLEGHKNGIIVCPSGSGKSWIIAAISNGIKGNVIVLQPTKEILEQNLEKMLMVDSGADIGVYSASMNRKDTGKITFATIGSVVRHKEIFADCELIIVDECDAVNSKGGMYEDFINSLNLQTLGLTATPFRLRHYNDFRSMEHVAESRILTRTRPRIFSKIIHVTQIKDLFEQGYLCPLDYDWQNNYDSKSIKSNSTNQGYNDSALQKYNEEYGITNRIVESVEASESEHCLAFCQFTDESKSVVSKLRAKGITAAEVSATTDKKSREDIVRDFRSGQIRCAINVNIFSIGFDFPELDCVIVGKPTKSLKAYYQMIGRGVRVAPGKTGCKVYDLCDNVKRFGKIESFVFEDMNGNGIWRLRSDVGYVTGVNVETGRDLEKIKRRVTEKDREQVARGEFKIKFGRYAGKKISEVDTHYLKWCVENFDDSRLKILFKKELAKRKSEDPKKQDVLF